MGGSSSSSPPPPPPPPPPADLGAAGQAGNNVFASAPTLSGGNPTNTYADPTYDYGHNTYTGNTNLIDTSKYFIKGSTGIYNLLPQLSTVAGTPNAANNTTAYNNILGSMANDAAAQAQFKQNFGTDPNAVDFGLGSPDPVNNILNSLSGFAAANANPSFVAYKPPVYKPVNVKQGGIINLMKRK